jgi:hypothetical protein
MQKKGTAVLRFVRPIILSKFPVFNKNIQQETCHVQTFLIWEILKLVKKSIISLHIVACLLGSDSNSWVTDLITIYLDFHQAELQTIIRYTSNLTITVTLKVFCTLKLEGLSFLGASLIVPSCLVDESPITLSVSSVSYPLKSVNHELDRRHRFQQLSSSVVMQNLTVGYLGIG